MIENVSVFRGRLGEVVVPVHGDYAGLGLAGRGEVTNGSCSKFKVAYGCDRVELHNHVGFDGVNYAGKVFVKKVFMSCDKPSCPRCYKYGWAVREGKKMGVRLDEASKMYGDVEHLSVSVPLSWYRLPFNVLVRRVWGALVERGAVGGALIFHRDRFHGSGYSNPYWSFHFHFLGFVPGRDKCRSCKKACFKGCGGFVDRNYRLNEKDGLLVKVLGKRKTVAGTAWYQLHHSSYRFNVKRVSVVRWMGVCSYRNLKVKVEKRRDLCPACGHDLVKMGYFGDDPVVKAWLYARRDPEVKEKRSGWFLADEDGRRVWVPIVGAWDG
jgi:uncharacterized protein with PIN domain